MKICLRCPTQFDLGDLQVKSITLKILDRAMMMKVVRAIERMCLERAMSGRIAGSEEVNGNVESLTHSQGVKKSSETVVLGRPLDTHGPVHGG
jgi:hypothetical protein